jgi:subfamily B ATP-binding cassette protein MsbA
MNASRLLSRLCQRSSGLILLSVTLGFSGALFNGIGITLIIPLILSFLGLDIIGPGNLPPILNSLFSLFDVIPDNYRSVVMLGTIVITILLKNLANYANSLTTGHLTRKISSNLRQEGFRLLLDVDLHFFSEMRLGELMNSINVEVNRVSAAVQSLIRAIIAIISVLVFLVILLLISWKLTIISTILLGAVAASNQLLTKYARSTGKELSRLSGALSSRSIEVLSGIRLVKSVAHENSEYEQIEDLVTQRERATFHSQLVFASIGPINEVTSVIALIVLIIAGQIIYSGQMEVFSSIILTYLFVLTRLLPFVGQLNTARSQLANTAASVEIVESFLNRDNKPIMESGNRAFKHLEKEIKFSNLWFQYPNIDRWTLKNIDLTLPKGHTLALVGSSGAGKSTMADLLARFYDPVKGQVEIDGIDLKEFDLHQYRSKIGIVSQETFLFNASVSDNIRYGCPDATDEEVYKAAEQANAAEFITNLEHGFSTQIGDRGVMLSGGQRQRLAIARALLQNPEILILDEATSALDTVSERLVQEALENLSQERTTLVIAHRLSTVQKANKIAVLDKGEIVEVGAHEDLLAKNGKYAKLYSMQFSDHPSHDLKSSQQSKQLNTDLGRTSYEIRSQLGGMLGLIGLLDDNMVENPEEYEEMTTHAYQSALNIIQSLEKLEKQLQFIK